ncbi:hypothetical protein COEX109129_42570 [Corallococcus exiguus]
MRMPSSRVRWLTVYASTPYSPTPASVSASNAMAVSRPLITRVRPRLSSTTASRSRTWTSGRLGSTARSCSRSAGSSACESRVARTATTMNRPSN